MNTAVAFLSGLGLGGVIVAIVNHYLSARRAERDRLLSVRLECYAGYLKATGEALDTLGRGEKPSNDFGSWEARAQLVASGPCQVAVRQFSKLLLSSPVVLPDARSAYTAMMTVMRADLEFPPAADK